MCDAPNRHSGSRCAPAAQGVARDLTNDGAERLGKFGVSIAQKITKIPQRTPSMVTLRAMAHPGEP
jgi:hypothetical protein